MRCRRRGAVGKRVGFEKKRVILLSSWTRQLMPWQVVRNAEVLSSSTATLARAALEENGIASRLQL